MVLPKMLRIAQKRVVVTGLGLLTPLGINYEDSWTGLCTGKCGIRSLTIEDLPSLSKLDVQIGGKLPSNFDLPLWMKSIPYTKNVFNAYASCVTSAAFSDAKWTPNSELDQQRTGLMFGSCFGSLSSVLENQSRIDMKGYVGMDRFSILKVLINLAAGSLSIQYKCKGPSSTVNTACASGQTCIGEAYTAIQRGDADVILAGAAEDSFQPFILSGFDKIGVLNSEDNGHPEGASRPFDEDRKGFVVGEGAGALVLEELNHALNRNAKIYAEIRGYGCAVEAEHLTRPSEDGDGTYRAMQEAMSQGGIAPQDIDEISAHGTSTLEGDYAEATAIMRLFRMPGPAITACSGSIGHLLGAAGVVQAAFTVLSIQNDEIPPIRNLKKPLSLYSGKIVPKYAKTLIKQRVKAALSNAFGFGGVNTSLLFTKYIGDK